METRKLTLGALLGTTTALAAAQSGTVTMYGTVDEYANYMHSSSGASIKALEDGAFLRSRLGFRGIEDLGDGLSAKFTLEMGINATSGAQADTTRGFDRQSWVGLASTTWGEVRVGRQNTAIFYRGDWIDFTSRTLGSIVNTFGVPSRYDNDFSYLSPRLAGAMLELHFAPSETVYGARGQAVYQAALDWVQRPYRVGYAGLRGKAPSSAAYPGSVRYDNFYANYDYGQGKVYVVFIRTNNSTASGGLNNAGTLLGNVGGVVAGTNPDVNRTYDISQVSVDYKVTPLLRLGAIYGRISDTSDSGRDAKGGVLGAYYDLSKRTMLYALLDRIDNGPNAGFRPAGSAGLPYNFTNPNDVNGRKIDGAQLGILHRF